MGVGVFWHGWHPISFLEFWEQGCSSGGLFAFWGESIILGSFKLFVLGLEIEQVEALVTLFYHLTGLEIRGILHEMEYVSNSWNFNFYCCPL